MWVVGVDVGEGASVGEGEGASVGEGETESNMNVSLLALRSCASSSTRLSIPLGWGISRQVNTEFALALLALALALLALELLALALRVLDTKSISA